MKRDWMTIEPAVNKMAKATLKGKVRGGDFDDDVQELMTAAWHAYDELDPSAGEEEAMAYLKVEMSGRMVDLIRKREADKRNGPNGLLERMDIDPDDIVLAGDVYFEGTDDEHYAND